MKKYLSGIIITLLLTGLAYSAAKQISTTQSGEVNASTENVWALLIDVNKWAEWNPAAVKKATLVEGDGEHVGSVVEFHPIIGGKKAPKVKLTLIKSQKPSLYEFSAEEHGMDIVLGFTITEKDGVATVTSYETISGRGVRIFESRYGQEGLDQEHMDWVEAIKKKLESQ